MPRCRDFNICGLEGSADPEAGLCILHSRQPGKDPAAFAAALAAHRERRASDFTRMVFPGPADFGGAEFGAAFFNGTVFRGPCDFTGASFKDVAFFHGAVFEDEAGFALAGFALACTFSRATFHRVASFTGATFQAAADFTGAVFGGEAGFTDVSFESGAAFGGAVFEGEGSFRQATFVTTADFTEASFHGAAGFPRARFGGAAVFRGAGFLGGGDFREALFGSPGVDVGGARFVGQTVFGPRREAGETVPVFAGLSADFRGARLEQPGAVTLVEADLSACRLLEADVRWMRLIRPRWLQAAGGLPRSLAFDEVAPPDPDTAVPWGELERLYRELRANAEAAGELDRAGEFYLGLQEMRRRNPATPTGVRTLLGTARQLSGYGEQPLRVLAWTLGLWLAAAAGYLLLGISSVTGGSVLEVARPMDWLRALHFSLGVMTLTPPWDLVTQGAARGVQVVQHLLGPTLLALLILAVRRRLRH